MKRDHNDGIRLTVEDVRRRYNRGDFDQPAEKAIGTLLAEIKRLNAPNCWTPDRCDFGTDGHGVRSCQVCRKAEG